jgi:hypothetical protein
MKRVNVINATILFLILGTSSIANAQHDQQGNDQNRSKQAPQHQQAQSQQQTHQRQSARTTQSQARPQQTYGGAYHGGV